MVESAATAFAQVSRQYRERIDAALQQYVRFGDDCPRQLADAISHSLLAPGKRLRPMLVLMASEACGSDPQRAMPAACAVEMVHTYSLVHDDLPAMDDDDMRRGRPSCHAMFGEAVAILVGDALLARAFEIVSGEVQPPETAARCCQQLAHAAGATALVGGQVDDLSAEFNGGDWEHLKSIHERKTGALFCGALQMGGMIAQVGDEQLSALRTYGQKMGLAFQIVDDLLDLRGDEATLGKRAGKDLDRGKLTVPSVLGDEESREYATQLIQEACHALTCFGSRASGLESLAHYVLERNH